MGAKNIHSTPFDKGTITKLELFEDYTQAWIPTFVMSPKFSEIHIFDFFAGPGYDKNGIHGSPIRILQKIDDHLGNILSRKTKIVLHFNEFEPNRKSQLKFEALKENCEAFMATHPKFQYFLTVKYYNQDAAALFFELLPSIKAYPSLVFLDQNGVKFISQKYLDELEKLTTIDFIYFVSSSFFKRYGKTDEFKQTLTIDIDALEATAYNDMHRLVVKEMKRRFPQNTDVKLFPFSIKKKANIYGIIFGSKNYLAVDKFLHISWKRNGLNGEADFDIDQDQTKGQTSLFAATKLTKIQKFKNDLEEFILKRNCLNNKQLLILTYENGHIPKHSVAVLKKMKAEGKLDYERSPYLNYDNVFRKKNIVEYKIKRK